MPRCPARLPGPSPLPRRNADPRPAGGHSPRPAPAPPPAGASRPPGRALACRCAWTCQSTGHRSARSGETRAFLVPAGSGSVPDHAGIPGHSGRGHRPCHSATLIPDQPGAQSPRPAPAPPPAGASRPPGRALACGVPGPAGLRGTVPHGRGNAVRFLFPPAPTKALSPLPWQGPSPLPQRYAASRPAGAPKPPASARPALGGRFSPAGSGAGLCWCGLHRSWSQRRARAGKRSAFPVPARRGGVPDYAGMPGISGRGHRPCHSATLPPRPAGGPKPPASARPAPGGRFSPAGSGAGLCWCGWRRSSWQRPARAGETHAFPVPARRGDGSSESEPPAPLQWQGPSPLPQRHAALTPAWVPKPPASARPAPGRRFSPAGSGADLSWCGLHGSLWQRSARAGETQCVSCSRPERRRKIGV
jgi:hypothetical protein